MTSGNIGIFDSGFGGLTILDGIRQRMPEYDYIYLGDNARAPYGTRSFDVVYEFTLQAVKKLFEMDCPLVILGCNTASAKALRSIQQKYLPKYAPDRRVLGVIRPTAEVVGTISHTKHIGVLATEGTIKSESYKLEIEKLHPDCTIVGQACPMWVPLVENNEFDKPGADYFVKDSLTKLMSQDPLIDTIILGCTHYPLLLPKIKQQLAQLSTVNCQLSTVNCQLSIHYANSSAIRLANIYAAHPVWCNRGVNGIEGSLSTAAGFSCVTDEPVFCVVGDLSFFYDQNALWNQNLRGNLRILLLNNGKGGIFHMLPGLEQSAARDTFVAAEHHTTAEGICQQNRVRYLKATNMEEMQEGVDTLTREACDTPMLLEVFTNPADDQAALRGYYQALSR